MRGFGTTQGKINSRLLAKVNDAIKMRYEKIKGKFPLEWN